MGREIRRVPKGWEHPRDEKGNYRRLFDWSYATAARKWLDDCIAWDNGTAGELQKDPGLKEKYPFFWDYDGAPPDPEYCRPDWAEEATCYQVYETVSEGTPTSPVFETEFQMIDWLVGQGHSPHAAEEFVKAGWAPSFMVIPGVGMAKNMDAFDFLPSRDG